MQNKVMADLTWWHTNLQGASLEPLLATDYPRSNRVNLGNNIGDVVKVRHAVRCYLTRNSSERCAEDRPPTFSRLNTRDSIVNAVKMRHIALEKMSMLAGLPVLVVSKPMCTSVHHPKPCNVRLRQQISVREWCNVGYDIIILLYHYYINVLSYMIVALMAYNHTWNRGNTSPVCSKLLTQTFLPCSFCFASRHCRPAANMSHSNVVAAWSTVSHGHEVLLRRFSGRCVSRQQPWCIQ